MPTCDGSRPTCELGQVASLHLLRYFKQQSQRKVRQFHVLHRSLKRWHFGVIKLAIALRYLAGGSYLDLAFAFCVSHKHVMSYEWQVVTAIDASLDNIKFPLDNEVKL
ncbi:hypothetical protein B484DRAFT_433100 [Ochromonadaceae sp. CCMP2298]|nr:hypothetical protein B484DRAFT_433100 [Ochromonadaceae sp. CCMP2298]